MKQPTRVLRAIVDQLPLAICVLRDRQLVYSNTAAQQLAGHVLIHQRKEFSEFVHEQVGSGGKARHLSARQPTMLAPGQTFTARSGERFQVTVISSCADHDEVAVALRTLGATLEGLGRKYRLSRRERQVAELVLQGYGNLAIADALGISSSTAKKHLSHIFDKVGVDTRSQLIARLT